MKSPEQLRAIEHAYFVEIRAIADERARRKNVEIYKSRLAPGRSDEDLDRRYDAAVKRRAEAISRP